MNLPRPEPGLVNRYAYLWETEALVGRDEASKDRPCAIVAAVERASETLRVVVLPITHSQPTDPKNCVEIPRPVKLSLGLDDERSWIVVSEGNDFNWPGPDLRPVAEGDLASIAYGFLPPGLFDIVRRMFLDRVRGGDVVTTPRTE